MLNNGDVFPDLSAAKVGGGTLSIPKDLAGSYAVVLFYRGGWCSYCDAQLVSFAQSWPTLRRDGIAVVALSADGLKAASKFVWQRQIPYPVGFGLDPDEVAAATGAYISREPPYVGSGGFVLDPQSAVLGSVYSSSTVGLLMPSDVVEFVRMRRESSW